MNRARALERLITEERSRILAVDIWLARQNVARLSALQADNVRAVAGAKRKQIAARYKAWMDAI